MPKVFVALWSRDTDTKFNVDLVMRLAKLRSAVDKAHELYQGQNSADFTGTLKAIFVAPEYLFSRVRATDDTDLDRAMSADDAKAVGKKLGDMSKARPDMLLVPGTVIY